MRVSVNSALAGVMLVCGLCGSAFADISYLFQNVTSNGGAAFAAAHNSMFSLNVADAGSNSSGRALADFTFRVDVTARPSSICDTYFYNGSVAGIAGITSSAGVEFVAGATPAQLPGYSEPFTSLFSADSNSPVLHEGVNHNNEWLTIRLELTSGATFAQLIQQLNTGAMTVGIHVQGQANGQSNSYTSTPVLVPLPAALPAGAGVLAVGGVLHWRRRRR
jgi:hypothetical protein